MIVIIKAHAPRPSVRVTEKIIKQVRFFYLGSYITESVRCTEQIKRICKGKTFQKIRNILTNSHLSSKNKTEQLKIYGQLYGSAEAWAMGKQMKKGMEAFEMWSWLAENILGRENIE